MKTYPYYCLCGKKHTAWNPRKSQYLCRDCKTKRDQANKKARVGTEGLKKRLIKERGQECEICGLACEKIIAHHKKPVSQTGRTTKDNIQLVCESCHKKLHKASEALNWQGWEILTGASDD